MKKTLLFITILGSVLLFSSCSPTGVKDGNGGVYFMQSNGNIYYCEDGGCRCVY